MKKQEPQPGKCPCGSGHVPWWSYDWRTEITTWICDQCTEQVRHDSGKRRLNPK